MTSPHSEAIEYRRLHNGLIGVRSKIHVRDSKALSLVYTPGVGEPCLEVAREPGRSFDVTCRGNTIAIVSDGSSAFGLGSIGPEAILPVLESKAIIMKNFAGVDALPLAINASDPEDFIETVINIGPTFGGISLEDVSAPAGLTITSRLEEAMNIPVINNHREGVAIGILAGLINATRLLGKSLTESRIVINGAGTAGLGVAGLLHSYGAENVIVCDTHGAVYKYRPIGMNWAKWSIAHISNPDGIAGDLDQITKGADIFVGLTRGASISAEMIKAMAKDPILFTFGSPIEIKPGAARSAGAAVVATAHSTYPNQMDISSVVPGVFRGLLDVRARSFGRTGQIAAAEAIASIITDDELHADYIYPRIIDYRVAPAVAKAVASAALADGSAKSFKLSPTDIAERTRRFIYEGHFPVPEKSSQQLSLGEESLELHERFQGLLEVYCKIPVKDEFVLNEFYLLPKAMEPAEIIFKDKEQVFELTGRGNLVGVVTDGSAVLGLGNIGGRAALPVMEGKAILFHTFAGVEAFPICLTSQDPDEIIETVLRLEPTFGGINLEDISAPRCFYVERELRARADIPIFHDDQHGTAVVVVAAMLNACRLTGKRMGELRIVVNGAGASGVAVSKLLMSVGVEDVILLDTRGAIYKGRREGMNWIKREMADVTNLDKLKGDLAKAVRGRDVFVGLSAPGVLTQEMIKTMSPDPMILALANPIPEIMPDEAKAAGAGIVATGRSDLPNQVNNSLAFPGIFRGALDTRATDITDEMKIAAAEAIAGLVSDQELKEDWIIPKGTDFAVAPLVAEAVASKALEQGLARVQVDPAQVAEKVRRFVYEQRD